MSTGPNAVTSEGVIGDRLSYLWAATFQTVWTGLDRLELSYRAVAAERGLGNERAGAVGDRCSETGRSKTQRCSAAFILRVGLCRRGGEADRG